MEPVDRLKQKLEGLMKYYFKGCTGLLTAIKLNAGISVMYENKKDTSAVVRVHDVFKNNYPVFDEEDAIIEIDEFSEPLVVLNKLVPKLNTAIDLFVANPSEASLNNVETMVNTVSTMGNKFRTGLITLQNRVRDVSGHQNYSVGAVGYDGCRFRNVLEVCV